MHWFNYVWIIPIAIGLFVWILASVVDIIATIRDYIADKKAGNEEDGILTFMDDYLEDYTKSFIATVLFVLFFSSFVCFLVNCVSIE